jgi:DNA-binding transcriptional LysR family regulator
LLAAFQRRYPDIQVYVYSTERRMDLIEDGIDVALRVGAIVHKAMVARHVLSLRNVLVASPKLVQRFGMPDEPNALRRFPCAVWTSRIDVPARWELGAQLVEPRAVLSTNDYHHLCNRRHARQVAAWTATGQIGCLSGATGGAKAADARRRQREAGEMVVRRLDAEHLT